MSKKTIKQITFSIEEVQMMMMKSFVKGEEWGAYYTGWFDPSEKVKAAKAAKDCEEVYKNMLLNKL
jgi:hypothetical protein